MSKVITLQVKKSHYTDETTNFSIAGNYEINLLDRKVQLIVASYTSKQDEKIKGSASYVRNDGSYTENYTLPSTNSDEMKTHFAALITEITTEANS